MRWQCEDGLQTFWGVEREGAVLVGLGGRSMLLTAATLQGRQPCNDVKKWPIQCPRCRREHVRRAPYDSPSYTCVAKAPLLPHLQPPPVHGDVPLVVAHAALVHHQRVTHEAGRGEERHHLGLRRSNGPRARGWVRARHDRCVRQPVPYGQGRDPPLNAAVQHALGLPMHGLSTTCMVVLPCPPP